MKELLLKLKHLASTPEGWIAWIIANIIVSSPWLFVGSLWLITGDNNYLIAATSIWSFQMLPLPIESFMVAVITIAVYKLLTKKKPQKV
jgi:hypothetical protein